MALEKWSLFFSTVISTCGWVPKNWCFWTVVLKKALSPSHSKVITPVYPKGNQPWIFTGRTYAETEALILWPPDAKSRLTGKDPEVGKDIRQEQKRMTEDEMVGWHHRLNGHEFEPTPGDSEGRGSLACCSSWGRRVRHDWATEQQHNVMKSSHFLEGSAYVTTLPWREMKTSKALQSPW